MEIDLGASRAFIPDTLVQGIKGQISASIETKGILPDSIDDSFPDYLLKTSMVNCRFKNIDINLDSTLTLSQLSGQLRYKNKKMELDSFNMYMPKYDFHLVNNTLQAQLEGNVSNIDAAGINLTSFHLATQRSTINGSAKIENLNHPSFSLQSKLDIDLAETKRFIPDTLVKNISGIVEANIHSEGMINPDSLSEQIEALIYDHSTLKLYLKNISLDMPDTLLNVRKVTGHVDMTPQLTAIRKLNGVYHGIDFQIDTTIVRNLYSTIFRDQPGRLHVEGVFRVSDLDYGMLGALMNTDSTNTEITNAKNTKSDPGKWDYEIKGKLYVNSLKYNKALISDISTLFNIKDSIYTFDQFKFKAFDGNLNSSINVTLKSNGLTEFEMRNQIDGMNIRKMLHDLDNFDQKEISYENINGILSTDEFFTRLILIGDSIVYPDLRMSGDITLEKGGVFNYGPVQALAPSIPGVNNLDTLELKTVNSHIFIFKNAVYVPKTYVVSNAFDISAYGMQSFGEDYQYHLGVHLGQILLSKSKKRLEKQDAMGDVVTENDKGSLFVKSYSQNGKDISGLDNKHDRTLMQVKVKTQETMLDLIFHPKLVSFDTKVDENLTH